MRALQLAVGACLILQQFLSDIPKTLKISLCLALVFAIAILELVT